MIWSANGTMSQQQESPLTITESKGGSEAAETLTSERVIETESHKRLTAKRST